MEAVKNRLTSFSRDSWAFIVNANPDLVFNTRDRNLDEASCGRKAHRIVEDCTDGPCQPVGLAHHHCTSLTGPRERDTCAARFPARFPALGELLHHVAKVHPLEGRPRE